MMPVAESPQVPYRDRFEDTRLRSRSKQEALDHIANYLSNTKGYTEADIRRFMAESFISNMSQASGTIVRVESSTNAPREM